MADNDLSEFIVDEDNLQAIYALIGSPDTVMYVEHLSTSETRGKHKSLSGVVCGNSMTVFFEHPLGEIAATFTQQSFHVGRAIHNVELTEFRLQVKLEAVYLGVMDESWDRNYHLKELRDQIMARILPVAFAVLARGNFHLSTSTRAG